MTPADYLCLSVSSFSNIYIYIYIYAKNNTQSPAPSCQLTDVYQGWLRKLQCKEGFYTGDSALCPTASAMDVVFLQTLHQGWTTPFEVCIR